MDEKQTIAVLHAFGAKFYELQQGFATMFNLCLRAGVFTEKQFHEERETILRHPDLQRWAAFLAHLESLRSSTAEAELEEALRKYKGPIQ